MAPLLAGQAPAEDGQVQTAIEDFAGVELDIEWVPGANYPERLTTTLASGDIPALVVVENSKYPAFVQAAEAGAFWDLTDKLDDHPNLTPESEEVLRASAVNGTAYGVYLWRDPMRTAVTLRQDWLDNLGLEVPGTTEDLHEVARAFTEQDPDGNGQDDTYGLILPNWNRLGAGTPYDAIETWFGAPNGWGEVDGELVPSFTTDEFFEANRFLRGMVEEGLVNPDFATFDGANWNDPFTNGEGGIIIDTGSRAKGLLDLFRQSDPEDYGDYVTVTGNLTGPDGELHALPTPGHGGVLAISKTAVPTEEMLDRVLSILDDLSSQEGQTLMINGVEGTHFNEVDDYAEPIVESEADEVAQADLSSFGLLETASNGKLYHTKRPAGRPEQELVATLERLAADDLEQAVRNPALAYYSEVQAERGSQLELIITDARAKYLSGLISEDELRAEIDRWFAEGGQQIVDDINELHSQAS
ncbi:extracellular solute-binding protein [Streptomyces radicis]|uniref:Extracellular solute-binding protein n=2 Tax=Streptomyces radicis TaxID=1750517 RepID=A0A3A9W1F2_9ACTN|nr:extracellular solute-binding protein [Streptomyces radicis]RKN15911.1 extracellular solute-binding protein [Streptomyces radicis]